MPLGPNAPRVYRFGAFELDAPTGDLRKQGAQKPRLQMQPLQVLLILLEHPQQVVTREDLRHALWPSDTFVDFDHSLNTAVNKLRVALGDSATEARYIETLPRQGYRFIAPVTSSEREATAASAKPAKLNAQTAASGDDAAHRSKARFLSDPADLPAAPPERVRILFGLIQVMYLTFYIVSLAKVPALETLLAEAGRYAFPLVLIAAVAGIPIRLYLLSAIFFQYRGVSRKFLKLFPLILPLDVLWALAPLLIIRQIGVGLALAGVAALLYVPFAERSLLLMPARGVSIE